MEEFESKVNETIGRQQMLEDRTRKYNENKEIIKDFSDALKERINTLQEEQNGFVALKTDSSSNSSHIKEMVEKNVTKIVKN